MTVSCLPKPLGPHYSSAWCLRNWGWEWGRERAEMCVLAVPSLCLRQTLQYIGPRTKKVEGGFYEDSSLEVRFG